MRAKIWTMCVVGLMLAAAAVCTAQPTTGEITNAVATADDGMYVRMDQGSSITLELNSSVALGDSGGVIVVYLCGLSNFIHLQSGFEYADFYDAGGYEDTVVLWVPPGPLSPLTITGAPGFTEFVAYVDGVQVLDLGTEQPLEVEAVCSTYEGPVTVEGPTPPTAPAPITIDIKPGSYPNTVNLGSHGVVPVALISTAEFDATALPPEAVFLAGSGVAAKGKGNKYLAHTQDVDGDGLLDLVVQVETENLDPGTFQNGLAAVTVKDAAGVVIYEGWDEITIVPQ